MTKKKEQRLKDEINDLFLGFSNSDGNYIRTCIKMLLKS